jgi:hypothetical protein
MRFDHEMFRRELSVNSHVCGAPLLCGGISSWLAEKI